MRTEYKNCQKLSNLVSATKCLVFPTQRKLYNDISDNFAVTDKFCKVNIALISRNYATNEGDNLFTVERNLGNRLIIFFNKYRQKM